MTQRCLKSPRRVLTPTCNVHWTQYLSGLNYMNINCKKTKEMVLGSFSKAPLTPLTVASTTVERLQVYKLLGVTCQFGSQMERSCCCHQIQSGKTSWFLKKVKNAGVSVDDLIHYYQAVIRPLLEYASVVWHSSLSKEQSRRETHTSLTDFNRQRHICRFMREPPDFKTHLFLMY